jgi:outer membrane protein assembly factor BamC
MKIKQLGALSLALLALSGCSSMSSDNKRVDYRAAAIKLPALEIPPDLTTPGTEDHYSVADSGAVANYSDFAKGTTAASSGASAVLPEYKSVRLERNGSQRWLVVNDKAENVWPVVKAFWLENGFVITSENPQAGIMETDWAENRAKIPKDGLRNILGKFFDNLYDSGQRDKFHIRLERNKDGVSTEIYLVQSGKEEVFTADQTSTRWQPRPHDVELEATMLQLLSSKLGGAETLAIQQAETAAAEKLSIVAKFKTLENGNKIILMTEPFDRSWRAVGLALEKEGIPVEDKDRAKGIYFLHVTEKAKEQSLRERLSFWHKDESGKPGRYLLSVHEVSSGCEVSATNGSGASNAESQRIIEALYKALGK